MSPRLNDRESSVPRDPRLTIVTTPNRETAIPAHWREAANWPRMTKEIARMKAGQAELRRMAFVAVVSWRPI